MDKLKPCPFCGGAAMLSGAGNYAQCGSDNYCCVTWTEVDKWNTRTEDKLRKYILSLEKRLEDATDGWDRYRELRKEVAQDKYPSLTNDVILNKELEEQLDAVRKWYMDFAAAVSETPAKSEAREIGLSWMRGLEKALGENDE